MAEAHFLVVSFPTQSSVSPALEFSNRLVRAAARVTFLTSVSAYRCIIKYPAPPGLSYASFSDGYDDGFKLKNNDSNNIGANVSDESKNFMEQCKQAGKQKVSDLLLSLADDHHPVTCVVYTLVQTWPADVANEHQIPAIPLWIQPAAVLGICYRYFHGYDDVIKAAGKDPSLLVELPGLPSLTSVDLPSFLPPSDADIDRLQTFRELFESVDKTVKKENGVKRVKPIVLVNTFDALERDVLAAVDALDLMGIGPLIPSHFFEANDSYKNSGAEYMEWLDSKPASSVVYISFGSIISPSKQQMEEILNGLLETGRPFLWVFRIPPEGADIEFDDQIRRRLSASQEGMAVPWCSQVEVLSHPSVGCFVTHCGWNSITESIVFGVPMVCYPQWADQPTNAKLVEDVWRVGVRMRRSEDGRLESGEVRRCLEEVMGGEEMRKNVERWKDLAKEAVREGGSSNRNIKAIVEEMRGG